MSAIGHPIVGDTLLVLLNAHHETIPFILPESKAEHNWQRLLDTADNVKEALIYQGGQTYALTGRSMVVLSTRPIEETGHPVSGAQLEALRKASQPTQQKPPRGEVGRST